MKDVRNDMNATEDFFQTVGVGHIIAATLQFFGMRDISDSPQNRCLKDAIKSSKAEKWLVLSACIGNLLQKFVSSSLACPHHQNFPPDTRRDSVYEYACTCSVMSVFELDEMMLS